MSALSKVEMSVSAPFWGSEAVISMGMVVMSKRELNRLDVLARLDSDRLTARAAAELMTITPRQTYRLVRKKRGGGGLRPPPPPPRASPQQTPSRGRTRSCRC